MSLILLFTGLAGFLASFSLLQLDVSRMWIRYPIAILIAYGVFLLLLRLWLWMYGRDMEVDLDPDLAEVVLDLPSGGSGPMKSRTLMRKQILATVTWRKLFLVIWN